MPLGSRVNDHDGDHMMAGLLAGFLLFGWAVASCLCHVPRGPEHCISPTPTVDCAGGICPFRDPTPDAGSDP